MGLESLTAYLRERTLIDNALFIDGIKILADVNKFSFFWSKNTIRFDELKREKILEHQKQLSTYGARNSYSKTDHNITFMRVKEDLMMNNDQLKSA